MSADERNELHYIIITDNESEASYEVVYESYDSLISALDILFKSNGDFDIQYDLDEDMLNLEQFLKIINKNPRVTDLENPDNCETISEFKIWLDDYMEFIEIEEFLTT